MCEHKSLIGPTLTQVSATLTATDLSVYKPSKRQTLKTGDVVLRVHVNNGRRSVSEADTCLSG